MEAEEQELTHQQPAKVHQTLSRKSRRNLEKRNLGSLFHPHYLQFPTSTEVQTEDHKHPSPHGGFTTAALAPMLAMLHHHPSCCPVDVPKVAKTHSSHHESSWHFRNHASSTWVLSTLTAAQLIVTPDQ